MYLIRTVAEQVFIISQKEDERLTKWAPTHLPESTFPLKRGEDVLPKDSVCVWSEYSSLSSGEVLVTIEHCAGCSKHDWITRHNESQYTSVSRSEQKIFYIFSVTLLYI